MGDHNELQLVYNPVLFKIYFMYIGQISGILLLPMLKKLNLPPRLILRRLFFSVKILLKYTSLFSDKRLKIG